MCNCDGHCGDNRLFTARSDNFSGRKKSEYHTFWSAITHYTLLITHYTNVKIMKKLINNKNPTPDSAPNTRTISSPAMEEAVPLWLDMYRNEPPWLGREGCTHSLNLPAGIASEAARLMLTEFSFALSGGERAAFLRECLKNTLDNLSGIAEIWCALGGIVLKPYAYGSGGAAAAPDRIAVDVVRADRFRPVSFDSDKNVTGAVFTETKRTEDCVYTRLERHELAGDRYTVVNRAFRSERPYTAFPGAAARPYGREIPLDAVDDWRGIRPVTVIDGVRRPLFTYIRTPFANTVDPDSPLGVSVFAKARGLIEEADRQFSRTVWEYEAKEAAIDADENLFAPDRKGDPVLPVGRERLFRTYDFGSTGFLQAYSPEIRDAAMWGGLNRILRGVEFACGLAYGTLSELSGESARERTATEIRYSRQRSYASVNAMQRAWDAGFDGLLYAMETLCDLYGMTPGERVEKTVTWGDGVLEDTEAEYDRRLRMVDMGILSKDEFREWYFGGERLRRS